MAQSGFTPIVTYNTATASAVPVAGNLQRGELAVNVTDKKLYTKDSGGNVVNVGVGADATATLTNKTLTTPVLANPSYSGTTANGGTVTTIDINGGTIDATAIGSTTPAAGAFTTLSVSGNTTLGDAITDTVTIPGSVTVSGVIYGSSYGVRLPTASPVYFNAGLTSYIQEVSAGVINVVVTPTEVARFSSSGLAVAGSLSVTKSGAGYQPDMLSFATPTDTSAVYRIGMATGGSLIIGRTDTSTTNVTLDSSGNLTLSAGTLGYGTGAGGTVTQATSKSTAVTLNKPSGQITMNNAALAASTSVSFTLNNSLIAITDTVVVSINNNASFGNYLLQAEQARAGTVQMMLRNLTGGSLSDAVIFSFAIIKGVSA
jgi:hypothetical protein